jgi:hypothetical protein
MARIHKSIFNLQFYNANFGYPCLKQSVCSKTAPQDDAGQEGVEEVSFNCCNILKIGLV